MFTVVSYSLNEIYTPIQGLQGRSKSIPSLPFPPPQILFHLLMKLQQHSFSQDLGHTKLLPILGPLNLLGPLSRMFLACPTPTYPLGFGFNVISLDRLSLIIPSQEALTPNHLPTPYYILT